MCENLNVGAGAEQKYKKHLGDFQSWVDLEREILNEFTVKELCLDYADTLLAARKLGWVLDRTVAALAAEFPNSNLAQWLGPRGVNEGTEKEFHRHHALRFQIQ